MSLEFAYTFNENDTTSVKDYSTNGRVSREILARRQYLTALLQI